MPKLSGSLPRVCGLALGVLTACQSARHEGKTTMPNEQDLLAIEQLHQRDMAASKAGDYATLRSLMSEDAAVMPPGGKLLRGAAQLDANFARTRAAMSQIEVLDYRLEFEEVKVLGDYAYEWGFIHGAMRAKDGGETQHLSYKVMRILAKQPDGAWKVHRTIWNENPAEAVTHQ